MSEQAVSEQAVSEQASPRELRPRGTACSSYLTFSLAEQQFGVGLSWVREIVPMTPITLVPLLKPCMRGVTNLRGCVLPVLDLSCRLGLEATPDHPRKCLIVIEPQQDGGGRPASLLVDAVRGLSCFTREQMTDASQLGAGTESPFLHGVARHDPTITFLLDLAAVLASVGLV